MPAPWFAFISLSSKKVSLSSGCNFSFRSLSCIVEVVRALSFLMRNNLEQSPFTLKDCMLFSIWLHRLFSLPRPFQFSTLPGLRASSYEPGNRAGPVGGTNFVSCSYGKFNPSYQDQKCPKGPQNTCGTTFRLVSDRASHSQLKMFRHVQSRYPGWSVKKFQLSYRDLGRKNRDLDNRASPPSSNTSTLHMNTSKFL